MASARHFLVAGLAILVVIGVAGYATLSRHGRASLGDAGGGGAAVHRAGDGAGDYFSDGVTEDIIAMLSRSPDLDVASFGATMAYKGSTIDPREIGRSLSVDYVLEGSARQTDGKMRIVAR